MQQVIGIDISKLKFDVAIFNNGRMSCKEFSNCQKGFGELENWLHKNNITKVAACIEATGHYGENLAEFLYAKGNKVSVINPSCIKFYANSKLSRHKTDRIDSKIIAEYAYKNELPSWKPIAPIRKELRQLHRCIDDLKCQLTQVTNQLENKILCKLVKESWEKTAEYIMKQIKELTEATKKLMANDEAMINDYKNLQTIPGVSTTTACAILAELPDISSFKDARQLAAYTGLVPKQRTSGSSVRGASRLSKLGSASLRKSLYFPAIVATKYNPIIIKFYQKLIAKGKHKMSAIGAAMRKLLHIIFGVLKSKKPFDPAVCC